MSRSEMNLRIILLLSPVNNDPQIHLQVTCMAGQSLFQAVVEGQYWVTNPDTQALYLKYIIITFVVFFWKNRITAISFDLIKSHSYRLIRYVTYMYI